MTAESFHRKLEEFKLRGYYGVCLYYGEGVGADDSDVPALDRRIRLFGRPVGCLGETQVAWSGSVSEFLKFDFSKFPEELPNPPGEVGVEKINNGGWYVWGVPETIEHLRSDVWKDLQGRHPDGF